MTEAAPDEWRVVRELRLAALAEDPEAFCATLEREQGFDAAAWRDRLAPDGPSTTLLAWRAGEPAGLAMVGRVDDEVAEITSVWATPAGRGRGTGVALLETAVEVARRRGFRRVTLEVGDHNTTAQRLYARLGFTPTGRTSTMPPPKDHVTEHELARDL